MTHGMGLSLSLESSNRASNHDVEIALHILIQLNSFLAGPYNYDYS